MLEVRCTKKIPPLAVRRRLQWIITIFALFVMLIHSLRSSTGCIFQEGMPGMEFRAKNSITPVTPVSVMPVESAATVPPLSDTACRKDDPICTAPYCDNKFDGKSHSVALCMIVKEEEAYIDEFVDYHHALG